MQLNEKNQVQSNAAVDKWFMRGRSYVSTSAYPLPPQQLWFTAEFRMPTAACKLQALTAAAAAAAVISREQEKACLTTCILDWWSALH